MCSYKSRLICVVEKRSLLATILQLIIIFFFSLTAEKDTLTCQYVKNSNLKYATVSCHIKLRRFIRSFNLQAISETTFKNKKRQFWLNYWVKQREALLKKNI